MLPEYLDIPIFPLPNVTFFPQTYLPLYVFEPRYLKMTANCLGGDRLMGVALLKEGWQRDYFGNPPICRTMGVGKIVDHEQLANGCYNIVLEGLYRVRLIEEYPTRCFRTGRVKVLLDPALDRARAQVGELMREVETAASRLTRLVPQLKDPIRRARSACPHPLVFTNQLANAVVIDAYERQSILEQDNPILRLKLLLVQLHNLIHEVNCQRVRGGDVMDEE